MKRFNTFGEYMFDLLFAPLKRGKRAINQLYIFFRVMGRGFDDVKTAFFRVREEANVATASEAMLPVHGQDRDMPRLKDEEAEAYRTRLSMKGLISEWSGTRQGLLYALVSLGYKNSSIESYSVQNAERWAEFVVYLGHGSDTAIRELSIIYNEIQRVKEASSKLAYFVYIDTPLLCGNVFLGTEISSYSDTLLNTADSIVLIRDRKFEIADLLGVAVTSYVESQLVDADDLILIRDRNIGVTLFCGLQISSYSEELLVCAEDLILVQDKLIEKKILLAPITTSYKEEILL